MCPTYKCWNNIINIRNIKYLNVHMYSFLGHLLLKQTVNVENNNNNQINFGD